MNLSYVILIVCLMLEVFFRRKTLGIRFKSNQLITKEKCSILLKKFKKLVIQKIVKETTNPVFMVASKNESDFTLKRKTINNWM